MRRLGFVGFGEAAYHIAKGLRGEGLAPCAAFDIHVSDLVRSRAAETGTALCASNAELAEACDVIIAAVTADQALIAAQQTAPHLNSSHIYADIDSVSPQLKEEIAKVIEASGARFVRSEEHTSELQSH